MALTADDLNGVSRPADSRAGNLGRPHPVSCAAGPLWALSRHFLDFMFVTATAPKKSFENFTSIPYFWTYTGYVFYRKIQILSKSLDA